MPIIAEMQLVWEVDGPADGVPPVRTLRVPQGADFRLDLRIVDENGQPIDLTEGAPEITLLAKDSADGTNLFEPITADDLAEDGTANLAIPSADTDTVTPGTYVWALWIQTVDEQVPLVLLSPFVIVPSLWSAGGG